MSLKYNYTGVLLAAGKGTRMAAFSDRYPKPILPIANKPLLVHQIELLSDLGITEIVILIGYKGYQIARYLGDGAQFGVKLHYVEQEQMLGIAHALGQLESVVKNPFLMFLGDIYFVPKAIKSMFEVFEEGDCGAVLATKYEHDVTAIRRNYSVIQNEDGQVVRVIEKPRHVTNNLKGVGLYLFDLSIFDAIRRTPRTAMRDEYEITEAIQVMIDDGAVVRTVDAVHDDINLTYPDDLLKINLKVASAEKGGNIVHPSAELQSDVVLKHSVVGANVKIGSKANISNCVLFDGACVDNGTVLANSIVTPEKIVRCQLDKEGGDDVLGN